MADLLALQGDIKRDADGYADDFRLQYRHYQAVLSVFALHPAQQHEGILELVHFIAQVSSCFPKETKDFAPELMKLLDTHYAVLDPALRRGLVKALILLRNKGQLATTELHPLFFQLFRCQDKALRQMLFRHIVADIKSANQKQRNERLNRSLQNFLYGCIGNEGEAAAKPALAVLTELWRRHVWRDARTANVIASAAFHESSRIMLAAVKFFLGQDEAADNSDEESDEDTMKAVNPSKAEIYNASKKGTASSKRKKMAKLKRVMAQVKKQDRRKRRDTDQNFAAIQLLQDPQTFAEKLFVRLQRSSGEKMETRMAVITLISRVVGVHRLILLNFYPFLQRYLQPHQRDVTTLLAALIQACHELVPPDAMTAVLRQLVDAFVHDRARPEVMTLGLKTVRELCARMPLIMTTDLLQDLVLYKKFRNKEVASAARGLIGLFRELAPGMLEKRDRGRGADVEAAPLSYGAARVSSRVEGAELLQEALLRGNMSEEDTEGEEADEGEATGDGSDVSEEGISDADGDAAPIQDSDASVQSEDEQQIREGLNERDSACAKSGSESGTEAISSAESEELEEEPDSDRDAAEESHLDDAAVSKRLIVSTDQEGTHGEEAVHLPESRAAARKSRKRKRLEEDPDSMQSLKRQLAEAKQSSVGAADTNNGDSAPAASAPQDFLEYGRILTEEDFERIRKLRHRKMVDAVMKKHGLKSASKRDRLLAEAEEEAEEALTEQDARVVIGETRVDPDALTGRHKFRKDKAERMESVLEGRQDRSYGAAAGRRKQKLGGLSNRQKAKQKNLPQGARAQVMKRRLDASRNKGAGYKGRKSRFR